MLVSCYLFLGSFAEEDIGRQGISVPSIVGNATASRGLEVAVANLQDYCNGTAASWYLVVLMNCNRYNVFREREKKGKEIRSEVEIIYHLFLHIEFHVAHVS